MTDVIDDGGPAYPMPVEGRDYNVGISLRDYFAAAALTGFASNNEAIETIHTTGGNVPKKISASAYEFADAMIAARSK